MNKTLRYVCFLFSKLYFLTFTVFDQASVVFYLLYINFAKPFFFSKLAQVKNFFSLI